MTILEFQSTTARAGVIPADVFVHFDGTSGLGLTVGTEVGMPGLHLAHIRVAAHRPCRRLGTVAQGH